MRGRAKRGPSFPGSSHGDFCEGARNLVEFCHEDQLAVQKNTEPPLKAIARVMSQVTSEETHRLKNGLLLLFIQLVIFGFYHVIHTFR